MSLPILCHETFSEKLQKKVDWKVQSICKLWIKSESWIEIQVVIDLLEAHHEGWHHRTNVILFLNPILTWGYTRNE